MTKMRRLNRLASLANTKTTMSCHEKNAIINVVALKRSQSRSYFEKLESEVLYKAKNGMNIVPVYNHLSETIEKNLNGWNGFLALLMSTWFFVDVAIELGARRWISRQQEKQYVTNIFVNFYVRLRGPKWNFIREEDWSALNRYIINSQRGSTAFSTFLLSTSLILLTFVNIQTPIIPGNIYEFPIYSF